MLAQHMTRVKQTRSTLWQAELKELKYLKVSKHLAISPPKENVISCPKMLQNLLGKALIFFSQLR